VFEGIGARLRREHNERAWLAWHVEALRRAKKVPPLKKLYAREPRQRRAQSWQDMQAAAKAWTLLLGGKVVRANKDA
jgi:hypothetical protein